MIQGISHITFIVSDLDRMTNLLKTVFGAEEVYSAVIKPFNLEREVRPDKRSVDCDHGRNALVRITM
jgi:catechol 2,3-dioxygenase-like lactoylglutathione lyase family enzyme